MKKNLTGGNDEIKQTSLINPDFLAGFMLALLLMSLPFVAATTFNNSSNKNNGITKQLLQQ